MPDRFEREIDDILRKVEDLEEHRKRRQQPPKRPASPRRPTSFAFGPSALSWLFLAGLIAAVVFIQRGGYFDGLVLTLVIVGLIAGAAYLFREVGANRSSPQQYQQRWRGQPLDLKPSPSSKRSFWDRFKRK